MALALTMLVLAATYSALTLFQRVTLAGREDAERSQLARAIEQRMTADIRCVLFSAQTEEAQEETNEPAAGLATMTAGVGAADDPGGTTTGTTGSLAGSASTGTATTGTATTLPTTPADAYATQSVGIFGDPTMLILHVNMPTRPTPLPLSPATPPAGATTGMLPGMVPGGIPRTSDLRSISYFLAMAGAGGLQGAVGNTAAGGTALFATEQGAQGLARLDGDRLTIQQADQAGSTDLLVQNATILAPEVTELTFRYFDGMAWVAAWDSVALNALPRAIEVTIRIDTDAGESQNGSSQMAPPQLNASDVYRFVVALPLADPTQGLAL